MKQKVIVVGGGIAGMEASSQLSKLGFEVALLEKENTLGGHAADWFHLFPDRKPSQEIVGSLKSAIADATDVYFSAEIHKIEKIDQKYQIDLTDGQKLTGDAIVVATGYDLYDARKKEEYGYKIYDNVISSADLEQIFKEGKHLKTSSGITPKRIALIHCVGSRDEKAGNLYCSKVCCVTGVKQAIEIKEKLPETEVFNFYMDLRMFDRHFEDLYLEAQVKHGVHFVRGRLSEACENKDGSLTLKVEDTLAGRPLKLNVDLMILLVGFVASKGSCHISEKTGLTRNGDNFFATADNHLHLNHTSLSGIFVAGACIGPKSISETIADARSVALNVYNYLNNCKKS